VDGIGRCQPSFPKVLPKRADVYLIPDNLLGGGFSTNLGMGEKKDD
jgi:hypothetical protein